MSFSKIKMATSNGTGIASANGFERGVHNKHISSLGIDVEFRVSATTVTLTRDSKIALVKSFYSNAVPQKEFYRIVNKYCGIKSVQSQLSRWNIQYDIMGKVRPLNSSLDAIDNLLDNMSNPAQISDFEFALDGDKSVGLKQTVEDSPLEMPNTSAPKSTPKSAPKSAPKYATATLVLSKDELQGIIAGLDVQQKRWDDRKAEILIREKEIQTKRSAYAQILSVTK